ncbi:MAG: YjgN family protein [Magnetospiraceae bacterium]
MAALDPMALEPWQGTQPGEELVALEDVAPTSRVTTVDLDLDMRSLFRTHWFNVAMTILSLGIYRFWAQTRVRQHLWSSVRVEEAPLGYTGRAGELGVGFLIGLICVLGPLAFLRWVGEVVGLTASQTILAPTDLAFLMMFVFFAAITIFKVRQYKLSRTVWRGLRGGMDGDGLTYAVLLTGVAIPTILTAGLALPWARTQLMAHKMRRTRFGAQYFDFAPNAYPLYRDFIPAYVSCLILTPLAVAVSFFAVKVAGLLDAYFAGAGFFTLSGMAGFALIGAAGYMVILVSWAHYRAAEYAHFARSTRYASHRFCFEADGTDFAFLWIGNHLISLCTLTLGTPWVYRRSMRFIADYLVIYGPVRLRRTTQTMPADAGQRGRAAQPA